MNERLVALFYVLLRDHLPAGEIEKLVQQNIDRLPAPPFTFSNKHLEAYARELTARVEKP